METIQSFFKFEITQTTKVLLYKIKTGDGKRWNLNDDAGANILSLEEIGRPENAVTVRISPNVLHFTTVHGYVYVVEDKKGDGASVTFNGPVNALLTQSLMPRMTYVPETLVGMCSDMDDYAPIDVFMEKREARHNGRVNPQDKYGWRVNMKFNNELVPWLPPFNGAFRDKPKKKSGKFARK
ncbi:MAG: hypothetical protein NC218_10830 [Acetobacter sp.]|nr:hypothetical protein [Acetobacter sp.]